MPVETLDWDETQYLIAEGQTEVSAGYTWGEKFDPGAFQQLSLMRYTGLLDKNAKEIFEGDCLRMKQEAWAYTEHLMQVEWSEEYAWFQAMVISTLGNAAGNAKVGTPYSMKVASTNSEIIGNIHENPDLLA